MSEPSVRGHIIRNHIDHLEWLTPDLRERLLRAVDPLLFTSLCEVGRLEWVPIERWMRLATPMHDLLGEDAYRAFWRRILIAMTGQPIFGNIVSSGVRIFGLSPKTFARLVPTAQSLSFKDAGSLQSLSDGANRSRIIWSGVPPAILEHDAMFTGFQGAFAGFFDLCKTTGTVQLEPTSEGGAFILQWV